MVLIDSIKLVVISKRQGGNTMTATISGFLKKYYADYPAGTIKILMPAKMMSRSSLNPKGPI
jgi:hypothetical protein